MFPSTDLIPEENLSHLRQAAHSMISREADQVRSELIAQTLIATEKAAKKHRKAHAYEQLCKTWQLCWVAGTKQVRRRAGVMMGAGRYLPHWLKINITYTQTEETDLGAMEVRGQVENSVQLGMLQLTLMGLVKFLTGKNLLIFDFTRMRVRVSRLTLYDGYIRGGKKTEASFYDTPIKQQAFFNYFLVDDEVIAARGKGGGLALWGNPGNNTVG